MLAGEVPEDAPQLVISAALERKMARSAKLDADVWLDGIERACRGAIAKVAAKPGVTGAHVADMVAAVIRLAIALRKPRAEVFSGETPGRLTGRATYAQWATRHRMRPTDSIEMTEKILQGLGVQANRHDLTVAQRARIKRRIAGIQEHVLNRKKGIPSKYPEQLTKAQREAVVSTGWNRWYNRGVEERALQRENVLYLQFCTRRDRKVCEEFCKGLEATVLRKTDRRVATYRPPRHYGCRCRWLQVTRRMEEKYGIKATRRESMPSAEAAPGFGRTR